MSKFLGWIFRMPLITRWGLMFTHRREDVSQHSHQVAVVSHLLAVIRNTKFNGTLDPAKAALIGLYHETAEVASSDLPSPVKYMNKDITREFKKIESETERMCLASLPNEFQDEFRELIVSDYVDEEYKLLVKAADKYCAYVKTKTELRHHNFEFDRTESRLAEQLTDLKKEVPELEYFEDMFLSSTTATIDEICE